jgi:hypothetical protein
MSKENKSFLEKIQSLDHKSKTTLLIVLSILAVFLIIFIWGAYFNFMIASLSFNQNEIAKNSNIEEKLKTTSAFVGQSLKGIITYFQGLIVSPKEYIIK